MSYSDAMRTFQRQQRSKLMHAVLMLVVVGVCGYMIFDLVDDVAYEIKPQALLDLGRVEGNDLASQIGAGDRFVQVTGIIGNRGAVVKGGRLSALLQPERWYRQFVGNSVLIEIDVGEDEKLRNRYQMFSEVTVQGRARFIHRVKDYANVIAFFKQKFGYDTPAKAILISVDKKPQSGYRALMGAAALTLVAIINVAIFFFVLRRKPHVQADAE